MTPNTKTFKQWDLQCIRKYGVELMSETDPLKVLKNGGQHESLLQLDESKVMPPEVRNNMPHSSVFF